MTVASWNVRTLGDNGATSSRPERSTALVAKELNRYGIDIAALSETRLAEEGQLREKEYTFYWSGRPSSVPRQSGVGLAIKNEIASKLVNLPRGINDRLMQLRLQLRSKRFMTIISAYAPTMTNPEEVKEQFYSDLSLLISSVPKSDKLLIMGDFNARVGSDRNTWGSVLGMHGIGAQNSNGSLLLSECQKHNLIITNTVFRLPAAKRTSWMHPRSKQWHLIDYVIVRQRDLRDVRITEAMRGADCWTDHNMIRSKLSLVIEPMHRRLPTKPVQRLNVKALQDPVVRNLLAENITNALSIQGSDNDIKDANEKWCTLRDAVHQAAYDTLGKPKRRHQDWFDENDSEIQQLLSVKNSLHHQTILPSCPQSVIAEYKQTCHDVQNKLRVMRDNWWNQKAAEIQGHADRHETKEFYSSLKEVYGPTHSMVAPLKSADGSSLLTDKTDILLRWRQHFNELLNMPSQPLQAALDAIEQKPEHPNLDTPPTLEEVQAAIKALKNGKTPGQDAIPAEVYKNGGSALVQRLHDLFLKIWQDGDVPQDFKDATIVTVYKKKGSKAECGNYRGISLLCVAGKILTKILFSRLLNNVAHHALPESQCGFRPNRGTADMIFAARQLQEKCREQNKDLYTVFVDLSKAFDTVNRDGLWTVLRRFGCTERFTGILQSLHNGMLGRVRVDGVFSEAFPISNGVRQGCIAGPILFNLFYAAMLDDALRNVNVGIQIRFRSGKLFKLSRLRASTKVLEELIQELLYADDCALEAHTLHDIQALTDSFANSASRFGLTINIQKTEVMFQPAPGKAYSDPQVNINGVSLKPVSQFCYLGSTLSNDAQLDKEITNRVSKASSSYGMLSDRVWKQHGIKTLTKVSVYKAVVLSNLLFGCETWTCYRRHIKQLEQFHMRHLRAILKIKWQDKISNIEILERSRCSSIEAMIISAQLRWVGHVVRMADDRIPKQLLYGELAQGKRSHGGQKKRFKDTLKHNMIKCNIDPSSFEALAADRPMWRGTVKNNTMLFERKRCDEAISKRLIRKQNQSQVVPMTSSSDFACMHCGKDCHSRIGLFSHLRKHRT